MKEIKVGDIVTRRSYGGDIFFRVDAIDETQGCFCKLRGICYRLCADAPLEDLEKKHPLEINAHCREHVKKHSRTVIRSAKRQGRDYQPCLRFGRKENHNGNYFEVPGKVLHLDGDNDYRSLCQQHYAQLGVPCRVLHVREIEQAEAITDYLREDRPDILVLTGHDGLIKGARDYYKMSNYRHSQFYLDAVRKAREFEPGLDNLIIIAGGCQSFFEALIEAGANFASAPKRILIHALDPLLIAQNIAFASIYERIALPQFLDETMTGSRGIGGVQTRGKLRLGHPCTRGSAAKKRPLA